MIDSPISSIACLRDLEFSVPYCHRRTGECPNKATSSVYTQVAIMNVPKHEGEDDDLEKDLEEQLRRRLTSPLQFPSADRSRRFD